MGSYDSVGYRLIQQDSDSEGEDSQRTQRPGLRTVLRPGPTRDIMFLSVHNKPLIRGAFLAVIVIGLTLVITTITWIALFKKGFTFSRTELGIDFNWHPFLMTLSLIFLYGNGALIYRLIPARNDDHKLKLKLGHAGIMMFAFILMVIGLQAAFDSHNLAVPPKPNMYTLHSWVGLLAAILFGSVDPWIPGIPVPQVLRRHPGSAPAFPPVLRLQHPGVGRCRSSHGTPGESHLVQQGIWEEEC